MEVILNNLGRTIKQARIAAKLTQNNLAERIDVSIRFIMALENERKQPSFEVLCKLIHTLNISPEHIFYPEKAKTENEREQLIRLLSQCDERDIRVLTATAKELIESK